jgi:hypothetical protein
MMNKGKDASKSTCLCVIMTYQPNTANKSPTLQLVMGFFHVICHVVSLIANMSAIQPPASTGEARQERWQCNERGVGSGDATKNNEITALCGGGCDGQR